MYVAVAYTFDLMCLAMYEMCGASFATLTHTHIMCVNLLDA